jgi:hypothetical protein
VIQYILNEICVKKMQIRKHGIFYILPNCIFDAEVYCVISMVHNTSLFLAALTLFEEHSVVFHQYLMAIHKQFIVLLQVHILHLHIHRLPYIQIKLAAD